MRLQNTVAVVTGAASGIGRAIALTLADEGAAVAVADRTRSPRSAADETPTAEKIRANGGTAVFYETDVTEEASVENLIRSTLTEFNSLDILVNNAGIVHRDSVHDATEAQWDETMAVNLKGIFLCSKYAYPHLTESDAGRIINIASQHGIVGTNEQAAYCASKGGVINLTRQMAIDYTPDGITVNAISPGPILTAMFTDDTDVEAKIQNYREQVLTDRLGQPQDIADAAVFIAAETSGYITGHNLVVDGGYIAH